MQQLLLFVIQKLLLLFFFCSLAPLVKKVSEDRVLEMTDRLCDKLLNGKDQHRDIASIALKTIVWEVTTTAVAQRILVCLTPQLIRGITSAVSPWTHLLILSMSLTIIFIAMKALSLKFGISQKRLIHGKENGLQVHGIVHFIDTASCSWSILLFFVGFSRCNFFFSLFNPMSYQSPFPSSMDLQPSTRQVESWFWHFAYMPKPF